MSAGRTTLRLLTEHGIAGEVHVNRLIQDNEGRQLIHLDGKQPPPGSDGTRAVTMVPITRAVAWSLDLPTGRWAQYAVQAHWVRHEGLGWRLLGRNFLALPRRGRPVLLVNGGPFLTLPAVALLVESGKSVAGEDFRVTGKCNDWRNHVPEELRGAWRALSDETRGAVVLVAEHAASMEEWD